MDFGQWQIATGERQLNRNLAVMLQPSLLSPEAVSCQLTADG